MSSEVHMVLPTLSVRNEAVPPLLTLAFQPFFLLAALWSVVALLIWIVSLQAGAILPSRIRSAHLAHP